MLFVHFKRTGIRLVEIENSHLKEIGRVETYHDGAWYSVCSDDWDPDDGKVACTQLGYALVGDVYQLLEVSGEARMINLDCEFGGRSLHECPFEIVNGNCTAAGLLCLQGKFVSLVCPPFYYKFS